MKKRDYRECFYFSGVYCENSHVYECLMTGGTCCLSACDFCSDSFWKRLEFDLALELDAYKHFGFKHYFKNLVSRIKRWILKELQKVRITK